MDQPFETTPARKEHFIEDKIHNQRRYQAIVKEFENGHPQKIHVAIGLWAPENVISETVYDADLSLTTDPKNSNKTAVLVEENLDFAFLEPDSPDWLSFHEVPHLLSVKYYLHENGRISFDNQALKQAVPNDKKTWWKQRGMGVEKTAYPSMLGQIKRIVILEQLNAYFHFSGEGNINQPKLRDFYGAPTNTIAITHKK